MRDARGSEPRIEGHVAPGFEPVRDAFAANFAEHGEVGAAVCVYRDGKPVVELWGGLADREADRPWQRDTLAIVFSTTKGVTAACIAQLVERGVLDLEAPVAAYWPEFAANGKEEIRVSDVLTHRAGLAEVEGRFTLEEVCAITPVCEALAKQAPQWTPGIARTATTRAATAGSSARSCAASRASASDACWRASWRRRSGSSASSSSDCRPSSTRASRA